MEVFSNDLEKAGEPVKKVVRIRRETEGAEERLVSNCPLK